MLHSVVYLHYYTLRTPRISGFHAGTLLLCLKRFISRRGKLNLFINDNFKTFKSIEVKNVFIKQTDKKKTL